MFQASGRKRKDGTRYQTKRLSLTTTDLDVLRRFHEIVGCRGHLIGPLAAQPSRRKPIYQWQTAHKMGREVAALLFPFLGRRRQAKFKELWPELFGDTVSE